MEPRNQFNGMNSASLCSLAGRYDNPIPPRFPAPIDSLISVSGGKSKSKSSKKVKIKRTGFIYCFFKDNCLAVRKDHLLLSMENEHMGESKGKM